MSGLEECNSCHIFVNQPEACIECGLKSCLHCLCEVKPYVDIYRCNNCFVKKTNYVPPLCKNCGKHVTFKAWRSFSDASPNIKHCSSCKKELCVYCTKYQYYDKRYDRNGKLLSNKCHEFCEPCNDVFLQNKN